MSRAPTNNTMKIIDVHHISPPSNTVPEAHLPLTFFDIFWLRFPPMKRLFFYEFSSPLNVFLQATVPNLKHSLSLTLQHFFPFASKLICPPPPNEPYLLYSDGVDSVPLVIAVDSTTNFEHIVVNHIIDVKDLHPFVPEMSPARVLTDGTRVAPVLAVQVTLFPSSGICVGFAFNHAAADGMAFNHFVKSFASVCKTNGDLSFIKSSPPCHDRNMIQDPNGLASIFLNFWNRESLSMEENQDMFVNKVRTNLYISRNHIEKLKLWVSKENESKVNMHVSSFVVTCAFVWICMVKSQKRGVRQSQNENTLEHFVFAMNCRNRHEVAVPNTYFGNCLAMGFVSVTRQELLGQNGAIAAVRAIGNEIKEMRNEPLRGAEKWLDNFKEIAEVAATVAASPKLRAYETDFGWGRPKRSDVVHIDRSRIFSVTESRDEEGGIEISLALAKDEMEVFKSTFDHGLNMF